MFHWNEKSNLAIVHFVIVKSLGLLYLKTASVTLLSATTAVRVARWLKLPWTQHLLNAKRQLRKHLCRGIRAGVGSLNTT